MINGSCCCGGIKFTLSEPPSMMGTCHCSRCRKVGASIFVFVKKSALQILQGRDLIARYEPEPEHKYTRCFCSKCGTALGEIDSEAESFPIAANCLDDDPGIRNRFHEFVSDKPDWFEIGDDAKQFAEHPVKS